MLKTLQSDYMDFQVSYNLYVERAERTMAKLHLMTESAQKVLVSDWELLTAYNYTGGYGMPLEARIRGEILQENFIKKLFGAAKWAAGEAWNTLKAIGEKAGQLGADVLAGVDKVLTMVVSMLPGGDMAYDFIKSWSEDKLSIIDNKIKESIEILISWLNDIKDKVMGFITDSLDKIGDGIKKLTHRALDLLGFDKFLKEKGETEEEEEEDTRPLKIQNSKKSIRRKAKNVKKQENAAGREIARLKLLEKYRSDFIKWLHKVDKKVVNPVVKALISGWDIKQIYNSFQKNPTDTRGLIGAGAKWLIENTFDLFPKLKEGLIAWLNKKFVALPDGAGVFIVRLSKLLVAEYSAPLEELAKRARDVWDAMIGSTKPTPVIKTAAEELLDERFPDFMQAIVGGTSAVEMITRSLLGDVESAAKLVSNIFRRAITAVVSSIKELVKEKGQDLLKSAGFKEDGGVALGVLKVLDYGFDTGVIASGADTTDSESPLSTAVNKQTSRRMGGARTAEAKIADRVLRRLLAEIQGGSYPHVMKTRGQAAIVREVPGEITAVIYDQNKLIQDIEKFSLGDLNSPEYRDMLVRDVYMGVIQINPPKVGNCYGAWQVSAAAGPGMGKNLYGLAYALSPSGLLVPDRKSVSGDARSGWRKTAASGRPRLPLDNIKRPQTPSKDDDCILHATPNRAHLNYAYREEGWESDMLEFLEYNHRATMQDIAVFDPKWPSRFVSSIWKHAREYFDLHYES